MYPDLIARTCGYIGVLIALIGMGICQTPQFVVTPQQSFEQVTLSLQVVDPAVNASEEPQETAVEEPAPPEIAQSQAALEPASVEPEPVPVKPQPEPTTTTTTPEPEVVPASVKPVTQIQPESQPQPKPEPKPEPKPAVKPQERQKPREQKPREAQTQSRSTTTTNTAPRRATTTTTTTTTSESATQAAPTAPTPAAPKVDAAQVKRFRAQLSSLLVREIRNHLNYPRNAVRRKIEGTVLMEFAVQKGIVTGYRLRKSSGHKILDEAARKLAQSLVQFNTRLGEDMNYRVVIPIKYELI